MDSPTQELSLGSFEIVAPDNEKPWDMLVTDTDLQN